MHLRLIFCYGAIEMKKHMMLLINPVAGRGLVKTNFGEALEVFYSGGYIPTVYFTEYAGHARELARDFGGDYDLLVCLGGDGTLSDVMSGLAELPEHPPIGYIPIGTANDVATTLGLSHNLLRAARDIVNGRAIPYDLGLMSSGETFSYVAAFGAFTDVSYQTSQQVKQALGHLAYILEGMTRLTKLKHYKTRVEYDGGIIEEDLCFGGVTNSTSVAGLVRLDDSLVGLGDGKFELILIRTPTSVIGLNSIISGILSRNYNNEYVTVLQTSKVRFTFEEPVPWTRDGEDGGMHDQITLKCLPNMHKIIVSSEKMYK